MTSSVVRHARATAVRVPARPDSINSPGVRDDDEEFARVFRTGKRWPDFANEMKWIVEIENREGIQGVGETYRAASPDAVSAALRAVIGMDVLRANWRRMPTEDSRVYDAIESSVLDLAGKLLQAPVYQLLGGACRNRVECSGWTGRRTPEDAARKAHESMVQGHRVFKFKCSDSDPVREWGERISQSCGGRIKLLLDPNQRWKDVPTTLRLMEGVDRECMFGLEDPIEHTNYAGFRELREVLGTPIFFHISLPYGREFQKSEDLLKTLRERCVDGYNFNCSMFEFVRLSEVIALDRLPCWHGSEVDLGILEASALHACAAAASCTLPSDLFGDLVRTDDLLVEPIRFENGFAIVPDGPGLGVTLDRGALEKFQVGASIQL